MGSGSTSSKEAWPEDGSPSVGARTIKYAHDKICQWSASRRDVRINCSALSQPKPYRSLVVPLQT